MRTATTLAKGHDGKWTLVTGPDVSIVEQQAEFRSLLGNPSHEKFAELQYQESDGHVRVKRFRSPKDHAAHEKARAEELEAQKAEEERLRREQEPESAPKAEAKKKK